MGAFTFPISIMQLIYSLSPCSISSDDATRIQATCDRARGLMWHIIWLITTKKMARLQFPQWLYTMCLCRGERERGRVEGDGFYVSHQAWGRLYLGFTVKKKKNVIVAFQPLAVWVNELQHAHKPLDAQPVWWFCSYTSVSRDTTLRWKYKERGREGGKRRKRDKARRL